ncbi:MAG: LptF/LptG family permease [Candidatus Omnitrophica bacterium]|nr:LptF/LptG family permease [Candidatus Omnitrophota bacterium]
MRILRNYILKDFFSAFTFSLLILGTIMILIFLMLTSHMVLNKGVNLVEALQTHSFHILYLLGYCLPFAFLLGVLLSMGRLVADNEIVAIHVAGISLFRILSIFLVLSIIFSLFLLIVNDKIMPNLHYRYRTQRKNLLYDNIESLIQPGVFLEHFPNNIVYVSDKEGNKLKNVFIYEIDKTKGTTKVTFAKRGEFVTDKNILKLKLDEGFRDESSSENKDELYRLNFKVFFMDIPIKQKEEIRIAKKTPDMSLKEIETKIKELKQMGIQDDDNPIELAREYHKRISFCFSIITFMFLGFGVSLYVKHREKSINLGIAFITGLGGYFLFITAEALVKYRILIPSIGMWLPNLIIALVGIIFFWKNANFR